MCIRDRCEVLLERWRNSSNNKTTLTPVLQCLHNSLTDVPSSLWITMISERPEAIEHKHHNIPPLPLIQYMLAPPMIDGWNNGSTTYNTQHRQQHHRHTSLLDLTHLVTLMQQWQWASVWRRPFLFIFVARRTNISSFHCQSTFFFFFEINFNGEKKNKQ